MTGKLTYLPANSPWPAGWALQAPPHVLMRVKRLFPRADQRRAGHIVLSDTAEVARDLEWVLMRWPMETSSETAARLAERSTEHREQQHAIDNVLAGARLTFALEPARPLRDYQAAAADLAVSTRRLLLADDVGLGKTTSAAAVFRAPDALPALVVTLTHLPMQWQREINTVFPTLSTHLLKGTKPYDPAERNGGTDPDVLITSYSKLQGWADVLAGRVNTIVFDECQELRHAGTLKHTAAAQIADGATYRLGLSATPVFNWGGEIHSIYSVLAPDALGSRTEFLREWCGSDGYQSDKKAIVRDPRALGAHLRAEGLMLRRTRADVGRELPDVLRVEHHVDTDVDPLDNPDIAALAENVLHSADRTQRWQASGDLDWRLRQATGVAKAPHVADFVRLLLESEEKVVLFGWHREVYSIWLSRLAEFRPQLYTGTESATRKESNAQDFLTGDSRVLIMSLRAGAGLDGLQEAARVAVFGELDWSPAVHDQAIGRLNRDGQHDPVLAYFLVSDKGSDPVVADVLGLKRMQSEPLRDPDAPLLSAAADTSDRVKRLAQLVLGNRGVDLRPSYVDPANHEGQPQIVHAGQLEIGETSPDSRDRSAQE